MNDILRGLEFGLRPLTRIATCFFNWAVILFIGVPALLLAVWLLAPYPQEVAWAAASFLALASAKLLLGKMKEGKVRNAATSLVGSFLDVWKGAAGGIAYVCVFLSPLFIFFSVIHLIFWFLTGARGNPW